MENFSQDNSLPAEGNKVYYSNGILQQSSNYESSTEHHIIEISSPPLTPVVRSPIGDNVEAHRQSSAEYKVNEILDSSPTSPVKHSLRSLLLGSYYCSPTNSPQSPLFRSDLLSNHRSLQSAANDDRVGSYRKPDSRYGRQQREKTEKRENDPAFNAAYLAKQRRRRKYAKKRSEMERNPFLKAAHQARAKVYRRRHQDKMKAKCEQDPEFAAAYRARLKRYKANSAAKRASNLDTTAAWDDGPEVSDDDVEEESGSSEEKRRSSEDEDVLSAVPSDDEE